MVNVQLVDVTKRFGETIAVDQVNLDIKEGEFFTLLGPSGCGKTTTLRLIAGFYTPDEGKIFFGERLINPVPPFKRNTGMVFQNYAIFPHMNVFNNVAYGLKTRKVRYKDLKRKVLEVLELVRMEGLEKRLPSQLSGGQQQRIALARALVIEPDVLLLDEPLSNLDAKLRVEMRTEIRKIQRRLKITSIYVTHDQEEALCISDRMAVMNHGRIEQMGTPRDVYEDPQNHFVANFIGVTNFFRGRLNSVDQAREVATLDTMHGFPLKIKYDGESKVGSDILASLRPEAIEINELEETRPDLNTVNGVVKLVSYLGDAVRYEVETDYGEIIKVDIHNPLGKRVFREGEKVSIMFQHSDVRIVRT